MHNDLRTTLLDAALTAASRGWHVFPLRTQHSREPKWPAVDRWEQRATTDPEQIRAWWARSPHNIGLATGPSNLVVVDLDMPKGAADLPPAGMDMGGVRSGWDMLARLAEGAGEPMPAETYTVRTASGGLHLYFAAPAGLELRNTEGAKNGLGWKIDTRAGGGYVLAAGSATGGRRYSLAREQPVAALPGWLCAALTPRPVNASVANSRGAVVAAERLSGYLRAAVAGECDRIGRAGAGERNKALFIAAVNLGRLVAGGALDELGARQILAEASSPHVHAGAYTARQQANTITSGFKRGAARPRRLAA